MKSAKEESIKRYPYRENYPTDLQRYSFIAGYEYASQPLHMDEIKELPRQIAVVYGDAYHMTMQDTVKLASDIQKYAESYATTSRTT